MRKSLLFCLILNIFVLNAQNTNISFEKKVHDKNRMDKPFIMAHRMAPLKKGFAENSIETFDFNLTNYPDVIQEIDVRMTADNKAVLLHDDTLDRTSTGKGYITTYSYADLKNVNLKDGYGNILLGQEIPLLKDVLEKAKGKVSLMLDVKPGTDINIVMDIVKQTNTFNDICVICYSVEDGIKMNKKYPDLMIALGFNNNTDMEKIKRSGIPYNRLVALVSKVIQKNSFYEEIKEMGVPISFSAQGLMDVKPDASTHYKSIRNEGITILCTDSILNASRAIY